jgi:hypothetical protein
VLSAFDILVEPALLLEVSDKMPTIADLLLRSAMIGSVLFALTWFRWWMAIPALVVCCSISNTIWFCYEYFAWGDSPLHDWLHEQGWRLLAGMIVSDLLLFLGPAAGAVIAWRRQHLRRASKCGMDVNRSAQSMIQSIALRPGVVA